MLSICIPVYNYDISNLIENLVYQVGFKSFEIEIIVYEDGSDIELFQKRNENTCNIKGVNYFFQKINKGRASARNYFFTKARFDYLLFLDADTVPVFPIFLKKYINNIQKDGVVVGGIQYPKKKPPKSHYLRWKYGKYRESKSVDERMKHPYSQFISMNFLLDKSVFRNVRFDKNIKGYGHEDTLFGYQLNQEGISIKHIHSPVLHLVYESNVVFLEKSRHAIKNLIEIRDFYYVNDDFIEVVKLLQFTKKLKKIGLLKLLAFLYFPLIRIIEFCIQINFAPLFFFDLFKIVEFAYQSKKN